MMQRIGITGANGVLGKILCQKLDVMGIKYSCFEGDIRSKQDISEWINNNDFDSCIHLAAIVATKQVQEDLLSAYDVNTSGTINLLIELNKKWQGKDNWFFYASTSHVYESSTQPINENYCLKPISLYGKTKLLAEEVIKTMQEIKSNQINYCIGRIFSFYHSSQKPPFLYPNIIKRLNEEDLEKEFFLYGADSVRDFLNAEEVVDIIIKLYKKKSTGIFNIASGKPIKIRDFVQNLSNKKLKIVTTEQKDYLVADISKLKQELES